MLDPVAKMPLPPVPLVPTEPPFMVVVEPPVASTPAFKPWKLLSSVDDELPVVATVYCVSTRLPPSVTSTPEVSGADAVNVAPDFVADPPARLYVPFGVTVAVPPWPPPPGPTGATVAVVVGVAATGVQALDDAGVVLDGSAVAAVEEDAVGAVVEPHAHSASIAATAAPRLG